MSQDKTDKKQDTSSEAKDAAEAPAATATEDKPQAKDSDGNTKPKGEQSSDDGEGKPKKRRRRRRKRKSSNADASTDAQDNGEDLPEETITGIYEQGPKSDGRLRQLGDTFLAYPKDPVVASHLVEKYDLRPGMMLECSLGKPFGGGPQQNQRSKKKVKYNTIDPSARRVQDILKIEGKPAEAFGTLRNFGDLTIIMPEPRLTLEYPGCPPSCRLIDLFCPIGYGTRGMIVSPPKAGKTTLLQDIALGIQHNHKDIEVYALLIDERPEEVTEFRRNVPCTVWASSNDHTPERHCGLAIAAIERCRRLAEMGKDVVVLMDSLTRLGRAFNTAPNMAQTGRTLSGGLDAGAMTIPKQIFGAARKFEEGGSLTIIATALVDTGSRGDQVIFEEFKGTGNMELILDRKIAEQRIFPAIDLAASGTRNEDRLIPKKELATVTALRRRLLNMNPVMQVEQLLKAMNKYETNADLVGSPQTNEEPPQRPSRRNNSGLTR